MANAGGQVSRLIIASGYFNPLHVGHVFYLEQARALGDHLLVIVNSDLQVGLKGSRQFMPESDRMVLVGALRSVSTVILSRDQDLSVCRTLEHIATVIAPHWGKLTFAKGGDRHTGNIPEVETCARLGIAIVDGLGPKIRASSDILRG